MFSLQDVRFCAEEVTRQMDDAMSVYNMCNALEWLRSQVIEAKISAYDLTLNQIKHLGYLIKPSMNMRGFRTNEVTFQSGGTAAKAADIYDNMTTFAWHFPDMTPEEAYQEFEYIHPFKDGNGRVGVLLFNLKRGSIHTLVEAPEYKH